LYEGATVYDLDGKFLGKVSRVVNSDYFLAEKKGLLSDEEFRVPISCILHFSSSNNNLSIRLNINQSKLKHGSEVIRGTSGGSIPSSHEPDLIPTSKEVIRYTVNETEYHNEQGSELQKDIINSVEYKKDRIPEEINFACDLCTEKFDNEERLQIHRSLKHNTAIGV
jgi:hypothetical protein